MSLDISLCHWIFHLYLQRKPLRHAIIYLPKTLKPLGLTIIVIYQKETYQKTSKMYKYKKISNILRSLLLKVVTKTINKSLKLKPL